MGKTLGVAFLLGSERRPAWLRFGVGWILISNAADLVLTLWGLRLRTIWEGNPLIAWLLAVSPVLAVVLKLGVAAWGGSVLYWAYPRNPRLVMAGVLLVGLGMALVLRLHAGWVSAAFGPLYSAR
jgi:hypothetical protein